MPPNHIIKKLEGTPVGDKNLWCKQKEITIVSYSSLVWHHQHSDITMLMMHDTSMMLMMLHCSQTFISLLVYWVNDEILTSVLFCFLHCPGQCLVFSSGPTRNTPSAVSAQPTKAATALFCLTSEWNLNRSIMRLGLGVKRPFQVFQQLSQGEITWFTRLTQIP